MTTRSPASAGTPELVARVRAGEQGAWDQLVERYGELVWAVARTHGLGRGDACEVSQVTWLLLTQHLASIQQPERLGDWLLRTATREAYRMCRLRGRKVATPMSTTGSDPSARPGPSTRHRARDLSRRGIVEEGWFSHERC